MPLMTGNLSSPTRQISSQSQTLKREARRAQRAGFGRAAEQLYMTGAQAGIQEKATRGSGIRSAEEEVSTEAQQQRDIAAANAQRAGLIRQARLRDTGTTGTTGTAGTTGTTGTTGTKAEAPGVADTPTAPKVDYLKPYSPGVEQTQEEGDAIRRKSLQDAYDKLTNPEGAAGSMKEILKKNAAAVAPTPKKAEPTFKELLDPLNAYFDKRDAEKKAAELAKQPVVIGGAAQPAGYGAGATQAQKDAEAAQQRIARSMNQGPGTTNTSAEEPTKVPAQDKYSPLYEGPGLAYETGAEIRRRVGGATTSAAQALKDTYAGIRGKFKDKIEFQEFKPAEATDAAKALAERNRKRGNAVDKNVTGFTKGILGQ